MTPGGTGPGCGWAGGEESEKKGAGAAERVEGLYLGAGGLKYGLAMGAALGGGDELARGLSVELEHLRFKGKGRKSELWSGFYG